MFLGSQFEVCPFFCISLPEETFLKAGLEVHGFLGFELKFYVTVYRIVRSSYQTDLAWNYRAKYWSVQSFYFEKLKDFSLKLKTAFLFEKIKI